MRKVVLEGEKDQLLPLDDPQTAKGPLDYYNAQNSQYRMRARELTG